MATVRDGSRGVRVVVDVQIGVTRDAWDAPRVIGRVARTVARARAWRRRAWSTTSTSR